MTFQLEYSNVSSLNELQLDEGENANMCSRVYLIFILGKKIGVIRMATFGDLFILRWYKLIITTEWKLGLRWKKH